MGLPAGVTFAAELAELEDDEEGGSGQHLQRGAGREVVAQLLDGGVVELQGLVNELRLGVDVSGPAEG